MRELLDVTIIDVKYISIRAPAGDGKTCSLTIQAKTGSLTLQLVPARHVETLKVLDYRDRDRKKQKKNGLRTDTET
jgi:hypothetical protein